MKVLAKLWKPLGNNKAECTACARRCKIPDGSAGFCFIRQNRKGKLYLANYGRLEALQIDPIEKKPFNHFMPGTSVLGIGTSSCNFGCLFCQNHNISKERDIKGDEYSPEKIVGMALDYGVDGIAYTYNEPTIFTEYALDVAELAKEHGLFNVFVSNGYMTEEAVKEIQGLIDAVVVDFKGNGEEKFANRFEAVTSNEPVRKALLAMKKCGMHIEITDLVIPEVGDSLDACNSLTKWIARKLGKDTPVHFTRFYPDYKMLDLPPTPIETLERHHDIAVKNGLEYVYVGNVPGHKFESTYCPQCGQVVVTRFGYYINGYDILEGKCRFCGRQIKIVDRPKSDTLLKAREKYIP